MGLSPPHYSTAANNDASIIFMEMGRWNRSQDSYQNVDMPQDIVWDWWSDRGTCCRPLSQFPDRKGKELLGAHGSGGARIPSTVNVMELELLYPSTGLVLVSVQSPSITSIDTPNKRRKKKIATSMMNEMKDNNIRDTRCRVQHTAVQ